MSSGLFQKEAVAFIVGQRRNDRQRNGPVTQLITALYGASDRFEEKVTEYGRHCPDSIILGLSFYRHAGEGRNSPQGGSAGPA